MCPLLAEGFSLITPRLFERDSRKIPGRPGVYVILVEGGAAALDQVGYNAFGRPQPWEIDRFTHLYTGETFDLRGRIGSHLFPKELDPTFHRSLLALQNSHAAIWPDAPDDPIEWCQRLRQMLREHAMVAFKTCTYIGDVEAELITRSGSPLNIRNRRQDGFSRFLRKARQALPPLEDRPR